MNPRRHCEEPQATRQSRLDRHATLAMTAGWGFLSALLFVDVAQDPAALRDRLDELRAAARIAELLAELRDEDVDDLGLRLVVRPAVEMLQKHRAGDDVVAREGQQ